MAKIQCNRRLVFLLLVVSSLAAVVPMSDDAKRGSDARTVRQLSDEAHFQDVNNDQENEHNVDYDHEAFLGKEEAKRFEDLTPEESKRRLGIIYDKIDKDGDKKVTLDDMKAWLQYTQRRYIESDADRQWTTILERGEGYREKRNADEPITWEHYLDSTYGFKSDEDLANHQQFEYKHIVARDKKRWQMADEDKDGRLNRQEYTNFLHPENAPHMRQIILEETLEDIDKNKDGYVDINEFIGDIYPEGRENGDDEPEWVKHERSSFSKIRDKNQDGKMDVNEIGDWVMPENYDHINAEAKHLVREADTDEDGSLSKQEVLDKYELFVGSQATDFGEALVRHDEF